MKQVFLFLLLGVLFPFTTFAISSDSSFVREVETQTGSLLVVPEEMTFTERFIITELKELRTSQEALKREINTEMNQRELASIDRALAYSGNTVNLLWLIITMAVTGFGLVGWRTMKDVRENLTTRFEKEVQRRVKAEQKKVEAFMEEFRKEQLSQSEEILKNQEFIRRKQEAGYLWSQYNREENGALKLELLEGIENIDIEEDKLFIFTERSSIYVELGLWDKALESANKGLDIQSENTTLLYNKAEAQVMLEQNDDAIKTLLNIIQIQPGMRSAIDEEPIFDSVRPLLDEYITDREIQTNG